MVVMRLSLLGLWDMAPRVGGVWVAYNYHDDWMCYGNLDIHVQIFVTEGDERESMIQVGISTRSLPAHDCLDQNYFKGMCDHNTTQNASEDIAVVGYNRASTIQCY